ncbi:MAG: hypothetical protein N2053_08855 [Chitinispirillaceae bacterium]|nr:hypothetical protein [Chitinispirillaceae bacterium]
MAIEGRKKEKKRIKINSSSEESSLKNSIQLTDNGRESSEKEIRADLIYVVKKRINSGFYKSDTVIEEMVDYFAKVFDSPQ